MTRFYRNFIDFLTYHEKRVSGRQAGAVSGCARWKATPGATGIAPPEHHKHIFHSLMNISPVVESLVIPAFYTYRICGHGQLTVDSKVSELLDEHFSSQDSLTVLPTIPLEASLLYKDNLHLSAKGLRQVSGIILSNLYQVLAPNSYKPGLRRKSKSGRNAKSSNASVNSKHQHPPTSDPRDFALYCCPGAGIYT